MRYYKDRDFPEVKLSNADIVAVIQNPKQLARVILEQNDLIDRLVLKDEEIERLRTQLSSLQWSPKEDSDCGLYIVMPIERVKEKTNEIEHLRTQLSMLQSDKPAWATEEDIAKVLKEINSETKILEVAKEMRCNRIADGKRVCYEDCKWDKLCSALSELDKPK